MRALSPYVAALALACSGCAEMTPPTQAVLTYRTVPEGAELFEGGQSIGIEPVTRSYHSDGKSPKITTPDVVAVWPSGAKTSYFTLLPLGSDRVATIERPADAPGLQTDVDHAKTVVATRQREAERLKQQQLSDIARASARCKAQQSGSGVSHALSDDCQ